MYPKTVIQKGYDGNCLHHPSEVWIRAYQIIQEEHPSIEELALKLIERVQKAIALINENKNDNQISLDMNIPLGTELDASFAGTYFTIEEMAKMQLGYANEVKPGTYKICEDKDLIKQGFLFEQEKAWYQAWKCYQKGLECVSNNIEIIKSRMGYVQEKAAAKGNTLYKEGMKLVQSFKWSEAWYYFDEAVNENHREAMAELGHMYVYGLGVPMNLVEGISYLRQSAMLGSDYACELLWNLHDDGIHEINGIEAKKWCEEAAKRNFQKAIERLMDGFDTRDLIEILLEQEAKGNKNALWFLYQEYQNQNCLEKAQVYFEKALKASHVEALLAMGNVYADANYDVYDLNQAEYYYRQAADCGSEKAVLALAKLALKDTNIAFWNWDVQEKNETIYHQHKNQFAWYLLAAEGGCVDAMCHIAYAYHKGYPCMRDDDIAYKWAYQAAKKNDPYAHYQLGYFHEFGYGCEPNMCQAIAYYEAAAEKGIIASMYRLIDIYTETNKHAKANQYRFLVGENRN